MNTIRGPPLIEPGDRLPLAPCRCKGGFAAPDMRRLTVGQRALAFGTLRGGSGMFRKARSKRDQQKKQRTRLRESGADRWIRGKSKSSAKRLAARPCWRKTVGRSTSRKAPDARSSIAATAISSSLSTKAAAGSIRCRRRKGTYFRSPNILDLSVSLTHVTVLRKRLASSPAIRRGSIRQSRRRWGLLLSGGDIVSSRAPVPRLALSHQ